MNRIRPYITGVWYSLPVQLLLLHLRRYQVLLFFWFVLFAVINGSLLYRLGAHMLFLYPEYQGKVDFVSTMLVGVGVAIFVMSWNITTFILHSRQVQFLATTTEPFLKYCVNNAGLPLIFLIFYFTKAIRFDRQQELLSWGEIAWLTGGFLAGFVLTLAISFTWFFGADRTIYRYTSPGARDVIERMRAQVGPQRPRRQRGRIRVDWYLTPRLRRRQPRDVRHYAPEFIERIFTQHHLSAIFSVMLAFASLIIIGYFSDNKYFQIPAAASIAVVFAILVAVVGALSYFLGQWTLPAVIALFVGLNWLYQQHFLDPRNKAYGLDYSRSDSLPRYDRDNLLALSARHLMLRDSADFIATLEAWKRRQSEDRPPLIVVSLSGGGIRSATFAAEVLYKLDSLSGRQFTHHTTLMTGASGGMMGAAWYRELYMRQAEGRLPAPAMAPMIGQISTDLLNPVFASFAVRDLLAPPRRFTYMGTRYIKDRGFAFEQQLNRNTEGWLNKPIESYREAEARAQIPTMLLSTVITLDGRNLLLGTRPVRFLMRPLMDSTMGPLSDADAICFQSLFAGRNPGHLRFLSALRMNATFPYVLPNVWLPTRPVVDVMDAGFRDNTGMETAAKYIYWFRQWIADNCGKVILVEIRDKPQGGWSRPYTSRTIVDLVTKPALLTQNNVFRFQEYHQLRQLEWLKNQLGDSFERVVFEYLPQDREKPASLSFHLTQREKRDLLASISNPENERSFERVRMLLQSARAANPAGSE